jgi:glycerol-3-phosphate dehydrogenase
VHVELAARTSQQADELRATRLNTRYLPGAELPSTVVVTPAADLELDHHDLVLLAVPARALPQVVAAHGARIPRSAGVMVLTKGLVRGGTLPSAYVAERTKARAVAVLGGPGHAADALANGAALVAASTDPAFAKETVALLREAGLDTTASSDVVGVELAACAKNAAALAAAAAARFGPNAAGAAAGKVFAEVASLAHARGAHPATFTGLAGTGDLIATVLAEGSRNRRAGELLGGGFAPEEIGAVLGQTAEALDALPELAAVLKAERLPSPATESLAALVEGRIEPDRWVAGVTRAA